MNAKNPTAGYVDFEVKLWTRRPQTDAELAKPYMDRHPSIYTKDYADWGSPWVVAGAVLAHAFDGGGMWPTRNIALDEGKEGQNGVWEGMDRAKGYYFQIRDMTFHG